MIPTCTVCLNECMSTNITWLTTIESSCIGVEAQNQFQAWMLVVQWFPSKGSIFKILFDSTWAIIYDVQVSIDENWYYDCWWINLIYLNIVIEKQQFLNDRNIGLTIQV